VSQKLGAALYAEQAAAGAPAGEPGASTTGDQPGDEDVVDAEIVDEDDKQ
jgi:molecular chaperone DnaK